MPSYGVKKTPVLNQSSHQFKINLELGPRGPVVSTLSFNLSAESRDAGKIPAVCPGRCMSLSCAVKFPVAILYGVVICNFDEDL